MIDCVVYNPFGRPWKGDVVYKGKSSVEELYATGKAYNPKTRRWIKVENEKKKAAIQAAPSLLVSVELEWDGILYKNEVNNVFFRRWGRFAAFLDPLVPFTVYEWTTRWVSGMLYLLRIKDWREGPGWPQVVQNAGG